MEKSLIEKVKKERHNLDLFMKWLEKETKLKYVNWGIQDGEIFLVFRKGNTYYKYKGGKKWKIKKRTALK